MSKRHVLLALAALGAGGLLPAAAQTPGSPDLTAGRAIGLAYLAANPGVDAAALRRQLLPAGFGAEAVADLRVRARSDFRAGRVFVFKGWRLSETEARLFALLA